MRNRPAPERPPPRLAGPVPSAAWKATWLQNACAWLNSRRAVKSERFVIADRALKNYEHSLALDPGRQCP